MSLSVEIEGADEIVSKLQNISDSLTRNIGAALREGAQLIVDSAQANAPVDTGFLRDSIQVAEESDTSVTVVAEAEYAAFVEYGTRFMSAQPFFEPAIEEAKQQIQQLLRDAISEDF
jgi:HK97 gp10 family phage protein